MSQARISRGSKRGLSSRALGARGIEVLLLPDPVDSFSVTVADYEGEPFRLVTLGAAEFALIQLVDTTA